MKELASGRKPLNGAVKGVKSQLLIHDDKQLSGWREHFRDLLNRRRTGEVPPSVDEMAGHRNMPIRVISTRLLMHSCKAVLLDLTIFRQNFLSQPLLSTKNFFFHSFVNFGNPRFFSVSVKKMIAMIPF